MEIYKLVFKYYELGIEPIITTFNLKQIDYPNCELEMYIIEDQGFRVFYYSDDSKIVYIDIDHNNGDEEYHFYYNYVRTFKRDGIIDGILE